MPKKTNKIGGYVIAFAVVAVFLAVMWAVILALSFYLVSLVWQTRFDAALSVLLNRPVELPMWWAASVVWVATAWVPVKLAMTQETE